MYHVSAQGVDERTINLHYYYVSAKKKTKRLKGFQISYFYWSFSNDILAVKGLIPYRAVISYRPLRYQWRELPQVSFSSRQKFCRDKHVFVTTKHIFCQAPI